MSSVFHSEKDIVHALGYGIMLRSTDGDNLWKKKGIIGDFPKTIHLPTPKVRYAVGQSGSIIKTTDAEENWKFIRNGRGFIVGKKGKIFSFETN